MTLLVLLLLLGKTTGEEEAPPRRESRSKLLVLLPLLLLLLLPPMDEVEERVVAAAAPAARPATTIRPRRGVFILAACCGSCAWKGGREEVSKRTHPPNQTAKGANTTTQCTLAWALGLGSRRRCSQDACCEKKKVEEANVQRTNPKRQHDSPDSRCRPSRSKGKDKQWCPDSVHR